MIDLHTHHQRCGHAEGTLEDMARAAYAAGVTVFGWSDHAPLFAEADDHPKPGIQMARSQWDGYLSEAEDVRARLARELPGLDLRIGVEADYLPGTEATYRDALDREALDYVLGSVHEVGPWHIFKPATFADIEDVDAFHRGYWRALRGAAQSGLFDVLSHLDAIKAMVPPAESDMEDEITATLDCIADSGVAVEINGSGLSKAGELFPGSGARRGAGAARRPHHAGLRCTPCDGGRARLPRGACAARAARARPCDHLPTAGAGLGGPPLGLARPYPSPRPSPHWGPLRIMAAPREPGRARRRRAGREGEGTMDERVLGGLGWTRDLPDVRDYCMSIRPRSRPCWRARSR